MKYRQRLKVVMFKDMSGSGLSVPDFNSNCFKIALPSPCSGLFPIIRCNAFLQKVFDKLIESFIDNKVGIAEDFLSTSLAQNLKQNLVRLFAEKQLRPAGTGNQTRVEHDKLFRSDIIFWLDRKHENEWENSFFDLMDSFVSYLNETCYTGINSYEFHYTLYEPGSFYKKHIDQFRNNDSRQYSMIMYLNEGWMDGDGGELSIYHGDHVQYVSPLNGRSIFFKSNELAHEVLVTNKPRMSITGWLKS